MNNNQNDDTEINDKLDMKSPDLVNQNIEKLAELFPNCVTESAEGKAIDFDLLKQELNHAVVEGNKERYRLEWPGKREAIVTANLPTTKTLRPVREDSVDFDNTENIYIEGDNLEVLKLLQESYLGKIKMIYIDPPYNTGNDFVYKDNFAKDKDEELFESGQKDELSQRLVANPETSGRYHSDWLSMMYPRLKLARNLLKDDGVIFISIDDNEQANLKRLCDEIFGEDNFVIQAVRKSKTANNKSTDGTNSQHEYMLTYAKAKCDVLLQGERKTFESYKNPDNDVNGDWISDNPTANLDGRIKKNDFEIRNPITGKIDTPPKGRHWNFSTNDFQNLINSGKLFFKDNHGENERGFILKRYKKDVKSEHHTFDSLCFTENIFINSVATKDVYNLLEFKAFEYSKPTIYIQKLIESSAKENDIILDFFSGSATTAHAVMQLNAQDGGKRKFIMVQLPEACDEVSEVFKAGYRTIPEIGKERIRRAAKKIKEETNADIDYGFRVYRLDESNMQDVYYRPQDLDQDKMDLFGDNIKPDRTEDDLLAQVMLDWGLPLSLKIEQVNITGKKVFKVAENSLFACFDKGIDEAFAKEIAKEKPLRIVFKDAGFKDDTAKTNVKQLLKQISPETEMKVL